MKKVYAVVSTCSMLFGEEVPVTQAVFTNQIDAFELYMSLIEEHEYEKYLESVYSYYDWFLNHYKTERFPDEEAVAWGVRTQIKLREQHLLRPDLRIEETPLVD